MKWLQITHYLHTSSEQLDRRCLRSVAAASRGDLCRGTSCSASSCSTLLDGASLNCFVPVPTVVDGVSLLPLRPLAVAVLDVDRRSLVCTRRPLSYCCCWGCWMGAMRCRGARSTEKSLTTWGDSVAALCTDDGDKVAVCMEDEASWRGRESWSSIPLDKMSAGSRLPRFIGNRRVFESSKI